MVSFNENIKHSNFSELMPFFLFIGFGYLLYRIKLKKEDKRIKKERRKRRRRRKYESDYESDEESEVDPRYADEEEGFYLIIVYQFP